MASDNGLVLPSIEQIDSGEGMSTLYRVAFKNQLESLFTYGYSRAFTGTKGGNMYGPGVYCTFNLRDSIENVKTKPEYGNCIVQMRLVGGFNNFIIFDENLARKVYGDNWTIDRQLSQVTKFTPDEIQKITAICKGESALYHGRTAPAAYRLWRMYGSSLFKTQGVRGLIYKGNRDGHCALPYDFSAVIPYAVSFDYGKTFKKMFNENLYNYLSDHTDVEFRFGGKYHKVFNSVKGFTLVRDNGNKYNIVQNSSNKLISPFWFDEVDGQINAETGVFGFSYNGYHFDGSIFAPSGFDTIGCVLDPFYKEPFCFFDDVPNITREMQEHGFKTFKDYMRAVEESQQQEENLQEKALFESFINQCVKNVIHEDRIEDQDGYVTVDNFDDAERLLLAPESSDDVWFVQIIKRHKDNMDLHFRRNACEFIASYFIHDAEELEEKRQEIISVCRSTNSRAYMYPNKRSMINIKDYANNVLKPRFKKYRDYDRMGHEMEVAAGQSKDWPERKLCFLDIDSNDENVYNKVMAILKSHNIQPLWQYRSINNGWHILLPDKEQVRGIDFSVIDNGYKYGRFSTVGTEIDKPILLYARLRPNGYKLQQGVQNYKKQKADNR